MADHIVTVPLPVGSYPKRVYGLEVRLELHGVREMTEHLRESSVVTLPRESGVDVPALLSPPAGAVGAGFISCPFETIVRLGEIACEEVGDSERTAHGEDVQALGREAFGPGARAIFDGDVLIGPDGWILYGGNWLADVFFLLEYPRDAPPDVVRRLEERS